MQMMAYEPMVLLAPSAFMWRPAAFAVSDIIKSDVSAIGYLPGIFVGFLYILTIKFRKSPFDISTSHHAHQEMVRGLTTELSGNILALVELSHWYENVFLLGVVAVSLSSIPRGGAGLWQWLCASFPIFSKSSLTTYFPRVKWQTMLKTAWVVTWWPA